MAVVIGKETEVAISLDGSEEEEIRAYFPPRGSDALNRGLRNLRSPMLTGKTLRATAKKLDAARIAFFDTLCLRVENVDYIDKEGKQVPLAPNVEGWQGMIDADIKFSIVSYFEGRSVLSKADMGN